MNCTVAYNVVSMRSQSSPGSEIVSQALFGETVTVLEALGDYSLVRTGDDYEGWALAAHLVPMGDAPTQDVRIVTNAFAEILNASSREHITRLSMGSRVSVVDIEDADFVRIGLKQISLEMQKPELFLHRHWSSGLAKNVIDGPLSYAAQSSCLAHRISGVERLRSVSIAPDSFKGYSVLQE